MRARMTERTMLATAATNTAARTTVVTDSPYMAWAWSAESPASTISAWNSCRPTTVIPIATIATPTAADASAASAIRVAIPRPLTKPSTPRRPVADPAHRLDIARALGVVAEPVPKATDVDVDRPIEHVGLVVAPHRIEELVAGQHSAPGLDEGDEELELDVGQRQHRAVAGDLVAVEVDDEVAEHERRSGCAIVRL